MLILTKTFTNVDLRNVKLLILAETFDPDRGSQCGNIDFR